MGAATVTRAGRSTGLDVNTTVGDYNRFNTANGWTVTGTVTGFDGSTSYYQVVVDGSSADTVRLGAGFVKESSKPKNFFRLTAFASRLRCDYLFPEPMDTIV